MNYSRSLVLLLAATFLCTPLFALDILKSENTKQETFSTPDEAFKALLDGMDRNSDDQLLNVLGHEHRDLIVQSDKEASSETRTRLSALAKENLKITVDGDKATACIGLKCWPYPIPLVKADNKWRFDTAAGKEEILNRRIGRNELAALKFVDGFDDAQRAYSALDRTGDGVAKFAQKIISTKGQKDGLYWPVAAGSRELASPLAALVDDEEDFIAGKDVPYNGYYFKILTKQGANVPNGKHDYIINGNMIAGFALIAWPADYDASGVMTFVINQQGIVRQKNLGKDTAKLAAATDEYNPDATWELVDAAAK